MKNVIHIKATRIDCNTSVEKEVDIVIERKLEGYLDIWYIYIVEGGVTGYESCIIMEKYIEKTKRTGWHACLGTKGSWDALFITSREMRKVWKWVKEIEDKQESR